MNAHAGAFTLNSNGAIIRSMARAPQSLFEAVRRAKREDRLTDLLALVLEEHLAFANAVLEAAGLPAAAQVRARPQVPTRRGRQVDLEMVGFDEQGIAVARLWSENKTGARYQPEQLPDYAEDIPNDPRARQLITIVDDLSEVPGDEQSPQSSRWMGFTWQDVAVLAWRAGRSLAPEDQAPTWRKAARSPQAAASQRILSELLNYLEEEHRVVLNPLGHEHVASFACMVEASQVLGELVAGAARSAAPNVDDKLTWSEDGDSVWQCFTATGTWAEALGGWPDLEAADNDFWAGDRIDEPAFGVGYTFGAELEDVLLSAQTAPWRAELAQHGFSVRAVDRSAVYVRQTKYLAELIPAGVTLDAQTRVLTRWVDEALGLVAQHDPGIQAPPKPERRHRRASAPAKASDDGEAATAEV